MHNWAVRADLRFDLCLLWKSSNASWDSRDLPQSPPPHEAWARYSMQTSVRVRSRIHRKKLTDRCIQAVGCQLTTNAFARQLQWRTKNSSSASYTCSGTGVGTWPSLLLCTRYLPAVSASARQLAIGPTERSLQDKSPTCTGQPVPCAI